MINLKETAKFARENRHEVTQHEDKALVLSFFSSILSRKNDPVEAKKFFEDMLSYWKRAGY
jgi:hypothetical protein